MNLELATTIANEVLRELEPHFTKSLICGSIRRKCELINDIDIVAIPKPENKYQFGEADLNYTIKKMHEGGMMYAEQFLLGPKIKRFKFRDIMIDLYLADENTFETLVLIRTGSRQFNIRLTTSAIRKGWKLFADGSGLWSMHKEDKVMLVDNTEIGIIQKLLPGYVEPVGRTF